MSESAPTRRLSISLRWKIILPFLLLGLALGAGVAVLGGRLFGQAQEVRFLRQLRDSGQQAADEVVRVEDRMLEIERAIANTEGVPAAVALANAEDLRSRVLQLVVNTGADAAVVLDRQGTSLLAIRRSRPDAPAGDYLTLRGEAYYADWPSVRRVLGLDPPEGDGGPVKEAGLERIFIGEEGEPVFFIVGPLEDENGRVFGAVLVGTYLDNLLADLSAISAAHASLYDSETGLLIGTVFDSQETWDPPELTLGTTLITAARDPQASEVQPYRTLKIAGQSYGEVLTPFLVRNGRVELAMLGISLLGGEGGEALVEQYRLQLGTMAAFGVIALALTLLTGLLIAGLITRPLRVLNEATDSLARGDLDTQVSIRSSDEIGQLAQSFNHMAASLRETSGGRELYDQLETQELREDLRKTLTAWGGFREGQSLQAVVLQISVSGYAPRSGSADPTLAVRSLNEALTGLIPIINRHGGMVEMLGADTLRANFGVLPRPLPLQIAALQATHAGMETLAYIHDLNEIRTAGGNPPLDIAVGVATGRVVIGETGAQGRRRISMLGRTVDAARRIEQVAREMGGETMLISERTHEFLAGAQSQFKFGRYGRMKVEEIGGEIAVYEVLGRSEPLIDCSDLRPFRSAEEGQEEA